MKEQVIIVGCDDTVILTAILNCMKRTNLFTHNLISATRIHDLVSIASSCKPDLVILSFRNNQIALDDFNAVVKNPELPVFCLTRKFDEALIWNSESIVFTYLLDHISKEDYLCSRIHSVFLLKPSQTAYSVGSIAESHILQNQSHHDEDLSRYVMELDQKTETLLKIKERIADLYPRVEDPIRAELNSIVNSIKVSANDHKLWEDFKLYFEQNNPNFLFLLAQKHPELTTKDLKYCCYLKMNMTNDDIRNLLGINQESVRTHKYRLKKKMALSKEQDLRSYLREVDISQPNYPTQGYASSLAGSRLF